MTTLSEDTRKLVTEFARWKERHDNSSTTHNLWRNCLLSAFDNSEGECDDDILDIFNDAKLSEDDIEKYLGEFHLCLWILKEQVERQH
jgi:hypothetical protein